MNLTTMSEPIIQAKANAYFPSLIILWIVFLLANILITWAFKSKKTNWGKFWLAWFFTALVTGILLIFFTMSPEIISDWIIKLKELFK